MDPDRRDSLRRDVRLPFRWQALAAPLPSAELAKLFELPPALQLSGRFADLEAEFAAVSQNVHEPAVALALEVTNARITALQEGLLTQHPTPPEATLEIAASGIAFTAAVTLSVGSYIGIWLVLPRCYHVLCMARVCRCKQVEGGYRLAAELLTETMDGAGSKRLSRFISANN